MPRLVYGEGAAREEDLKIGFMSSLDEILLPVAGVILHYTPKVSDTRPMGCSPMWKLVMGQKEGQNKTKTKKNK